MDLVKIKTCCDCSLMFANVEGMEIHSGEHVIIQTKQGPKIAKVLSEKFSMDKTKRNNIYKVIRKATEQDIVADEGLREKKKEAFRLCLEKVEEHKLVMKLVDVEFLIDESKAIFYFTADGRVDFRELVKDLAHHFHTRIEMRQIGVRDEAKMIGGIGNCGKEFCCSSFLCSFEPVSVRMAKEQNLALNPMKISGACGRLMCCLSYEHKTYVELKKNFPPAGRRVKTENGEGKIVRRDFLNGRVVVLFESGDEKTYNVNEVELLKRGKDELKEKKRNKENKKNK
jgi:cell fate regulator YaaT (PSP1 superfamily)